MRFTDSRPGITRTTVHKSDTPRLEEIHSPADLRDCTIPELEEIAAELRETIITTVAKNGGHLAPSLGVVELTLALHKVFNTPKDKIVWDVGHQSYAHKIITGRLKEFSTLRQRNGMSGFPKRKESPYDAFETGHSSTSVSAASGMEVAHNLQAKKSRAIAVIGDGAMTAGMAYEALNHAGHLDRDLIVILNDNEMSISPNVGAISNFLSRKLAGRTMNRVKNHLVEKLSDSEAGENLLNILRKSEESFKSFFTPGMLFEAFKFNYVGPISGHDLDELIETLSEVRDISQGPVLVHVLTKKGRGYKPAEDNPGLFHGIGPFDIATGKPRPSSGPASWTSFFGKTLCKMAENDNRITAISAAMTSGTGLTEFSKRFPERFFDVGIAEQHAVTFAAGMASEGMRPVVAVYSTFFQRALDQIIHDVCLPNLPVTLVFDRAGVVGDDGPTHHGVFDLSFLRFIPNMVMMAPKDENELQHMIFTGIHYRGPSAIRYPRGSGYGVEMDEQLCMLKTGKGELLREGDDVLLLPVGNRVTAAMEAAKELELAGVSAAVINPRFIKPLDAKLICQWVKHTGNLVTVEDNVVAGGFGSGVVEMLSQQKIFNVKSALLGYPDHFIEHSPQKDLWKEGGIDTPAITAAALALLGRSSAAS
jgi:1-deoxy-D-xylulose-5-phosphate synthase